MRRRVKKFCKRTASSTSLLARTRTRFAESGDIMSNAPSARPATRAATRSGTQERGFNATSYESTLDAFTNTTTLVCALRHITTTILSFPLAAKEAGCAFFFSAY